MLKLLHCADLHLGSPFTTDGPQGSETKKNEQLSSFNNLIRYAKDNVVNMIVIAGDLFDSPKPPSEIVELVINAFASIPKIKIVIIPGNHDYFCNDSVWQERFPTNVTIFTSTELVMADFPELNTSVYGYAFDDKYMMQNPFATPFFLKTERINILLAHGDMVNANSNYCPITAEQIKSTKCDYIALGHIHNNCGIERIGDSFYGYSGSFNGQDFGENGPKGALLTKIEKSNGELHVESKFIRFSHRRYEIESINVTGIIDSETINRTAREIIGAKGYGTDTYLRLKLEGALGPKVILDQFTFKTVRDRVAHLEIKNLTTPQLDIGELERDPTIRGVFYMTLKPSLESNIKEEREIAQMALRYGLAALEGNNIIDYQ